MKNIQRYLIAGAIASMIGGQALADDHKTMGPRFYVGGAVGKASIDTGVSGLTGSAKLDEDDTGFKLYGGADLNQLFGIEAHYANFGEAVLTGSNGDNFNYKGATYAIIADGVKISASAKSLGAAVTAGVNVTKWLRPMAKLGLHRWDLDANVTSSAGSASLNDSGTDAFFGLGLEANIYQDLTVRVEAERFKFEDEDVDFVSLGLKYKF
ncbi:outer membrane beta-barrel protein [Terasakiella sp. SH-1]|uniref:outer membrane beta-barrel protein n=1 Tax=Terasakiella sp. SH-1 TaxID=2560057 RepID=UPI0010747AFD|nr:outer membrane beta-barrel protein [Terasakiella sp. SH-1]